MPRIPETILIDEDGLKELTQTMEAKAKTPKGRSLHEILDKLRKPIQKMVAAGYSYSDVASVLKEKKIYIPAATIRNHIGEGEQEVSQVLKKKTQKKREPETSAPDVKTTSMDDVSPPLVDTTPPEPIKETTKFAAVNGFNINNDRL